MSLEGFSQLLIFSCQSATLVVIVLVIMNTYEEVKQNCGK